MKNFYENAVKEFNNYIKQFNMANEIISRKYCHTFRVVDYAKEIT